ncbi:MAG: hypothetical protein IKX19_08580, partial [Clostridia bacterium]|nr:hypothetical protein [Clostridia bacterium]
MIVLTVCCAILAILLLLVGIAAARTLCMPKKSSPWVPSGDAAREKTYAGILAEMVRCETVSRKGEIRREKFLGFHKVLEELFPLVHRNLEKTEIDGSLLFHWKGRNNSKPVVLMGHQD